MRKIKFISDSTIDLPPEMLSAYDIDVVPLHILLGETEYLDDKSLTSKDLFRFADEKGTLPKSAAVNQYQFEECFSKYLDQDYDIFFMGISSKLSATMQNAAAVAEKMDSKRICIVDSLSLSTGTALQVLAANDFAKQGATLNEVEQYALKNCGKVQASFVVDTMKYLYMGGRCSKLVSLMGSTLKIKPKLELKGGEILPAEKYRGSSFVKKYVTQVMKNADTIDPRRVFVTHCLSPEADAVRDRLINEYGFGTVYITDASATISTHCGPGTLGVLFLYK